MNFLKNRKLDFERTNIKVPLMIFFAVVMVQAILGSVSLKMIFNLPAAQIILGGISISVIISFPMDVLMETYETIKSSFDEDVIDFERTVIKIYNLSVKIKKDGLLSIEDDIEYEDDIFIRDAMILLSDYKKEETIEDIMDHDIKSRLVELNKPYKVLEMVANIAPAFGLIGTLVGMIGLLNAINEPSTIMGNMASALISTLYGSLISNLIAFPLMARIQEFNNKKLLEYRMIKEGVLLIAKEDTTRNVFDKMNVMLQEDNRLIYPREKKYEQDNYEGEFEDYGFEELFK